MKQFFNTLSLGFFLATKQIARGSKWANLLIISVMMLTFLSLVATNGFLVGIVEGAQRQFKEKWSGDLLVSNHNDKDYIEHTDDIVNVISSSPQVANYSPRIIAGAKIEANWLYKKSEKDAQVVSNQIAGVDPEKEENTTKISKDIVEGEWLKKGDIDGIVLGSAYLEKYSRVADVVSLLRDIKPGDKVRVTVTAAKSGIDSVELRFSAFPDLTTPSSVTKDFTVRGILYSKVQYVASRAYIDEGELRKMLGTLPGDVSEIAITMKDGVDPYELKTPLLNNGFGEHSKINTALESSPEFLINIKLFFGTLGTIIGSISVVVALITIFIIIYINALTRRRQIGIMKAVGVNQFAIEFSYICQALFYIISGSAIAILLIFTVIKPFINAHPIDTPFAEILLVAEPVSVFIKFLLAISVAILAGYIPAKLIVRTNTLDAILGRNN